MTGWADMHCHILPGVDDGAEDEAEALELLRMEYRQGVRQIIVTPHYRLDYFETSRAKVRRRFQKMRELATKELPEMELFLGCEFHRQEGMFTCLEQDQTYKMAGSSYVLVEFSGLDTMNVIKGYAGKLLAHGYRPVIAHAERYPALRKMENIEFLIEAGAYIQINAGAILGREGWNAKSFCRMLLKEECVHFIGSDAHDMRRRVPCIGKCAGYLQRKIGQAQTKRLLSENPQKLLTNEYI